MQTVHVPVLDGPSPRKRKTSRQRPMQLGKRTVPDADVLAMRVMHQVDGKARHLVHRAFPQYRPDYINDVLGYIIRAQPHLWVNGGAAGGR